MAMLPVAVTVSAQDRIISGVVLEDTESGTLPVVGAGIVIKGTSEGTVTDEDGNFTLNASAEDVLEISSLGSASKASILSW